ncbi:NAD(P)-dependent oxidoreductase [Solicola gregarius]|uniref:NAD(P)H-binding protein n=1 Tax=Solicola gregarius TaxID=2908642 RepID=A0AA46TEY8_9ACTN|nr:NAD(P)H-binding protein [Solicola gregarius]UYM04117.1 NAD(P)H-binding protein [Solicola gregarius]
MRIAVFGALGNMGRRIVAEATAREHEVSAVVRRSEQVAEVPDDTVPLVADATDREAVAALAYDHDVIVGATRPPHGRESELAEVATVLLDGVAASRGRVVIVGGAGSLVIPETGGRTVVDDPRYLHPAGRPIANACADQLAACRAAQRADWTYLSPAASLSPGTRTGRFRLGIDELVVDSTGASRISMEDLAVALIDEVERPRHRRMRFTAAY